MQRDRPHQASCAICQRSTSAASSCSWAGARRAKAEMESCYVVCIPREAQERTQHNTLLLVSIIAPAAGRASVPCQALV